MADTPKIPEIMSCMIPSHCTGLECCVDVNFIGRAVKVSVDLDACSYRLSFRLGKLSYDIMLFDYDFGTWETFSVKGVFVTE